MTRLPECTKMTTRWTINKEVKIMSMTAFIIIVGLVLLTMSAISDAIALLKWLYEHDMKYKRR